MQATRDETSNIDLWPKASRVSDAEQCLAQLSAHAPLMSLLSHTTHRALIHAVAGNAPYLARLMLKYPEVVAQFFAQGIEASWATFIAKVEPSASNCEHSSVLMGELRVLKAHCALLVALADISATWDLTRVTAALSEFAESSVKAALHFLLTRAALKGEYRPADIAAPEKDSGIVLLGMGKLGAYELNYSSDIDLIVLFDNDRLPYTGPRNAQQFMSKLAGELVTLLEERTPEGYVFRTDLRLRPDPMSTPLAVTVNAALTYYETVGQNWERAAMIKARPVAGDIPAGQAYLRELIPYVWRKTLDFAAIADIHSIKRQMNAKAGREIDVMGHNIKTGRGGIREIEFYVQTQQLVWGGRIPNLRVAGTLAALDQLVKHELTSPQTRDILAASYIQLRQIEHRLQMRHDEQTHSLPKDPAAFREAALFCGFATDAAFAENCARLLQHVHRIYMDSMEDSEPLAVDGNLVFTGVEADPDTLETLARMGYHESRRISDIIQGWHRGHRRSTRSKRSRQVLTELVPALLLALAKTADPDQAFFHFDDFIARLPSGAQIFSLFLSRPEMLTLLSDILGSAPALGDTLSTDPSLLDSVLEADFFTHLPDKETLENLLTDRLKFSHSFEQKMGYLRIFNNEKRFQAGVHLLKGLAGSQPIGAFLSDLAEVILQAAMHEVWAEYSHHAPWVNETPFAVVALGKLGGREMTFGSDIDIVFLYDDAGDAASEIRTHIIRVSQRLVSALTLLTREGRLYAVDTRLRPGGSDGPLAVSLAAFDAYFTASAWTYEHMALTRARVVATNRPAFAERIEQALRHHVLKPRDETVLLQDVVAMRQRIAKEFSTQNPWALKHIRGGMVDLDFMAQYLVLREGARISTLWHRDALAVFETAAAHQMLDARTAQLLIAAKQFETDLMHLLRLCASGGTITDDTASTGLKNLLAARMDYLDFNALKNALVLHEAHVSSAYAAMAENRW